MRIQSLNGHGFEENWLKGGDVFFQVCWKRLNPYTKRGEIGIVEGSDALFLELIKVALKSVMQPNLDFLDCYILGLTKCGVRMERRARGAHF